MKRCLFLAASIIAVCLLASCGTQVVYRSHSDAYAEGLAEGIYEGYLQGTREIPGKIEDLLRDDLGDIAFDVREKYGMYPDEAIQMVTNYADGEPITEEDLHKAIWAIHMYYVDASDAIRDISEYYID